ncbi:MULTISPECIES: restriction endonuclease subunit S [unclassified Pseudonocardia]|uniref:restriction endonuclease subunit S n=1 Tax=unclassified Pseudonocardia TaxID=2619320 RepID=UPI00094ACF14|nr:MULTISPECIES: restriction endonuclease subunit S [unclassified Pseudonocardia]
MPEWPTTTVGAHVERCLERVSIDPGIEYDTMGVRWYGKGAYLRPPRSPQTKTLAVAREGDFVFCRIDTQNGPFAVVPADLNGALVTNEFPLYSVDSHSVDRQFLVLCFSSRGTLERIGKRREGRDGRARWKEADFEGWEIPWPPLEIQRKIVEVVSAVDATVDALNAEVKAARTARAALLDRLIRDLGEEVTKSTLRDVAQWSSGGTPKADNKLFYSGEIPWAIISDVRGRLIYETTRKISSAGLEAIGGTKSLVPAGSVLITMYGTIGNSAITGIPMATNQAICRGIPNGSVSADYLRLWISARVADLVLLAEGKIQQNISKSKIESFPIIYPRPENQQKVVDIMTIVDDQIQALELEIRRATTARAALLDSLLERKVDVVVAED